MVGPANNMGGGGGGGLLLIILILATSQGSDYRTVSYEALLPSMDTFEETGVRYFSEIVFDVKRYQMIVGARDALFRLSMDGLKLMEKGELGSFYFLEKSSFLSSSRVASHPTDYRPVHSQGTE